MSKVTADPAARQTLIDRAIKLLDECSAAQLIPKEDQALLFVMRLRLSDGDTSAGTVMIAQQIMKHIRWRAELGLRTSVNKARARFEIESKKRAEKRKGVTRSDLADRLGQVS